LTYRGSCHCGAVRFEVEAPEKVTAQDCNCSICAKSGFLHLIVPKSKFKLLGGEENLTTYTFNTGVAQHKFCQTCGVKSFYIPRSNPDGIDVNVRCLEPEPKELIVEKFDGRNWEKNAAGLKHLSEEKEISTVSAKFRIAVIVAIGLFLLGMIGMALRTVDRLRTGQQVILEFARIGLWIALPIALLIGWVLNRHLSRNDNLSEFGDPSPTTDIGSRTRKAEAFKRRNNQP
jgi:hypothetical protein